MKNILRDIPKQTNSKIILKVMEYFINKHNAKEELDIVKHKKNLIDIIRLLNNQKKTESHINTILNYTLKYLISIDFIIKEDNKLKFNSSEINAIDNPFEYLSKKWDFLLSDLKNEKNLINREKVKEYVYENYKTQLIKDLNLSFVDNSINYRTLEILDDKPLEVSIEKKYTALKYFDEFLKEKENQKKENSILLSKIKEQLTSKSTQSTLNRITTYLYSFLMYLNKEKEDYGISRKEKELYKPQNPYLPKYVIEELEENSELYEEEIDFLKRFLNLSEEESKFLTIERISEIIEKNYGGDIDFMERIILNDPIAEDDYVPYNEIPNHKKVLKILKEDVVENKISTIIITDKDSDGKTGGVIAKNTLNNFLNLKNVIVQPSKRYNNEDASHGINFSQIEKIVQENNIKTNDKFIIFTIDNGINNDIEVSKISKKYPNCQIIITDHHNPSASKVTETSKVMIYDYKLIPTTQLKEWKNFGISGAATFGFLMLDLIDEIKIEDRDMFEIESIKSQIDTLNRLSNYADLVHSKQKIKNKDLSTLSQKINHMNALKDWMFIFDKKLTKESFNKMFLINDDSYYENYIHLKKVAENLVDVYNSKDLEKDTKTLLKEKIIYKNKEQNYLKHEYEKIDLLRDIYIDLISKKLTEEEYYLLTKIQDIFKEIKSFEKNMLEHIRKNKDSFVKEITQGDVLVQIFYNIPRNIGKKAIPRTNNGIHMAFDNIKKDSNSQIVLDGSLRSIYPHQEIIKKQNYIVNGHDYAAGVKIFTKETDIKNLNSNSLELSDLEKNLKRCKKEENVLLVNSNMLKEYVSFNNKIGTGMSQGNSNPYIYVKGDQLTFNNGIEVLDVSVEEELNKEGYLLSTLAVGVNCLAKTHDLNRINKENYYRIKYMGYNTLIVDGVEEELPNQHITKIEKEDDITQKQIVEFTKKYNKKNNYMQEIDLEEFLSTQFLINNEEDKNRFLEQIEIKMLKLDADYFLSKDTEGTSFAKAPGLTNLGFTLLELDRDTQKIKPKVKVFNYLVNDVNNPTIVSPFIEDLTGITNKLLVENKNVLNYKQLDVELEKQLSNKKIISYAHNSPYDTNIIKANLNYMGNILNKHTLVGDTAPIAKNLNYAVDEIETWGKITFEIKEKEGVEIGLFNTTELKPNKNSKYYNVQSFLREPEDKNIYKNFAGNIILYWEKSKVNNNEYFLYYQTNEMLFPVLIGKYGNIRYTLKEVSKAKRYSVQESLKTRLVSQIKEEMGLNPIMELEIEKIKMNVRRKLIKDNLSTIERDYINKLIDGSDLLTSVNINLDKLSNVTNQFQEKIKKDMLEDFNQIFEQIDNNQINDDSKKKYIRSKKEIDEIITHLNNKDVVLENEFDNFLLEKARIFKQNYNLNVEELNDFLVQISKATRLKDNPSRFSKYVIDNIYKYEYEVNNLLKEEKKELNFDYYMQTQTIKNIVNVYNPELKLSENIYHVLKNKETVDESFIKDVIEAIEKLNKKMEKQQNIKKLMNMYGFNSYVEMLHEHHNNLTIYLSDHNLEMLLIQSGAFNKTKKEEFINMEIRNIIDTEYKILFNDFKYVSPFNSMTSKQIEDKSKRRSHKGITVELNEKYKKELIEKNTILLRIDEEYVYFKFNDSFNLLKESNYDIFIDFANIRLERLLTIRKVLNNYKSIEDTILEGYKEARNNIEKNMLEKEESESTKMVIIELYDLKYEEKIILEELKQYGDFFIQYDMYKKTNDILDYFKSLYKNEEIDFKKDVSRQIKSRNELQGTIVEKTNGILKSISDYEKQGCLTDKTNIIITTKQKEYLKKLILEKVEKFEKFNLKLNTDNYIDVIYDIINILNQIIRHEFEHDRKELANLEMKENDIEKLIESFVKYYFCEVDDFIFDNNYLRYKRKSTTSNLNSIIDIIISSGKEKVLREKSLKQLKEKINIDVVNKKIKNTKNNN